MRRRLLAGAAGALALVGLVSVAVLRDGVPGTSTGAMSEETFCGELRRMEVGHALAGEEPAQQVAAIAILAGIGSRAPELIRGSVEEIEVQARAEPALLEVAGLDLEDPSVQGAAFQATYRLRFQPEYRAAAARIERYAVERCGMEPSGRFDLDLDVDLDGSMVSGLDLSDFEPPEIEFDESTFEPYRLDTFEVPPFEFDRSDWDRYTLDWDREAGGG